MPDGRCNRPQRPPTIKNAWGNVTTRWSLPTEFRIGNQRMHVGVTAKNIICTIDRHRSVFLIALGSGQNPFKMSDESRQDAPINENEMCLQYVTPVWKQSDISRL